MRGRSGGMTDFAQGPEGMTSVMEKKKRPGQEAYRRRASENWLGARDRGAGDTDQDCLSRRLSWAPRNNFSPRLCVMRVCLLYLDCWLVLQLLWAI